MSWIPRTVPAQVQQLVDQTVNKTLEVEYFGNTLPGWTLAVAVFAGVFVVLAFLKGFLLGRLDPASRKGRLIGPLEEIVRQLIKATSPVFFLLVAVYAASLTLNVPPRADRLLGALPTLALLVQVGFWGNMALRFFLGRYVSSRQEESDRLILQTMTAPLRWIGGLLIWSVLSLLALDNLGVNVTALVAGLGVGGVAVALAVQNILGDLLGSLSIVLDKPFVIGDFIVVDTYMGTVENIGLKTTRIRSLSGEQIILSNSDLLKSRIRNYKRMTERRAVFKFRLLYDTPAGLLAQVPAWVREIIEAQPDTRFDRAHFAEFGDSALVFEVVYFVLDPDYGRFMDIQQTINLSLMKAFEERGIRFAQSNLPAVYRQIPQPYLPPEAGSAEAALQYAAEGKALAMLPDLPQGVTMDGHSAPQE
jgi:small-conductance mechanosensitive channel